ADELLSKDAARLSDDGIKVVKERVLQSAHGFLETTSTYDKVQAFKCPELAAELHRPLSCQARQWVSSNIVFVMTFCVLSAGLLKILWSIYQRRALSKRAEQIYEQRTKDNDLYTTAACSSLLLGNLYSFISQRSHCLLQPAVPSTNTFQSFI
uniref:Uncharacterized protein n=1 Tax=Aegilops tauschii subsp. strangulata TaxID=200361 RepID=A0A453JBU6_AEGTS